MAAIIEESRGRRDAAVAAYEQVLKSNPRAGVAANNLAWIRAEQGQFDEAVRLATLATEAMEERPEPHDTLGWAYYKQGVPAKALSSFERAIAIAPTNATYQYHLGLAQLKVGNKPAGRAALARAIQLGSGSAVSADARKALAEAEEESGQIP